MNIKERIAALPEWPKPMRGMPLESAADQLDSALARLALAREWIEVTGRHSDSCHYGNLVNPRCTCGRDALLKALEVHRG